MMTDEMRKYREDLGMYGFVELVILLFFCIPMILFAVHFRDEMRMYYHHGLFESWEEVAGLMVQAAIIYTCVPWLLTKALLIHGAFSPSPPREMEPG
jgi:hypothetical protein